MQKFCLQRIFRVSYFEELIVDRVSWGATRREKTGEEREIGRDVVFCEARGVRGYKQRTGRV